MARRIRHFMAAAVLLAAVLAFMPAAGASDLLFKNENPYGVSNSPTGGNPQFTISGLYTIDTIYTYHWNYGQGRPAGQIWLTGGPNNLKYGPWQATVVSRYYWGVNPQANLPAGTYTIWDSEPSTWAYNASSKNQGFAQVYGTPINLNALPTFDDVKGRVGNLTPQDRIPAINTLPEDKKGPVQISFGLRPKPTATLDKTTVKVGDYFKVTVNNPLPGWNYQCSIPYSSTYPGNNIEGPASGPVVYMKFRPPTPGTVTIKVQGFMYSYQGWYATTVASMDLGTLTVTVVP